MRRSTALGIFALAVVATVVFLAPRLYDHYFASPAPAVVTPMQPRGAHLTLELAA